MLSDETVVDQSIHSSFSVGLVGRERCTVEWQLKSSPRTKSTSHLGHTTIAVTDQVDRGPVGLPFQRLKRPVNAAFDSETLGMF